ncbi:MAG: hypothetical protein O3A01_07460, partial [bacterium]|nr:hypothetical protein [bacterium]
NSLKKMVTVPEAVLSTISTCLNQVSALFSERATKPTDQNRRAVLRLKETLLALLDGHPHTCITDTTKKNATLNTTHTLNVTTDKMTYIERNKMTKTVIKFDMESMVLRVNDVPAKDGGIHMVFDKLEHMGNLLSRGDAELFVKDGK